MKKLILIVIVISAVIAGGVLFAGFLNNQEDSTSSTNSDPEANSPSPSETPQEQAVTGSYTTAEVSQHSTQEDCWIIIESQVYDVTNFLAQHPGGIERITPFCGQDASEAFATQGGEGSHSSTATQLRENFLIGALTE